MAKRTAALITIFLLQSTCLNTGALAEKNSSSANAELKLTISFNKQNYHAGDEVILSEKFTNLTSRPLAIVDRTRTFNFSVKNGNHRSVKSICGIRFGCGGPPGRMDGVKVTIAPGQSYSRTLKARISPERWLIFKRIPCGAIVPQLAKLESDTELTPMKDYKPSSIEGLPARYWGYALIYKLPGAGKYFCQMSYQEFAQGFMLSNTGKTDDLWPGKATSDIVGLNIE